MHRGLFVLCCCCRSDHCPSDIADNKQKQTSQHYTDVAQSECGHWKYNAVCESIKLVQALVQHFTSSMSTQAIKSRFVVTYEKNKNAMNKVKVYPNFSCKN